MATPFVATANPATVVNQSLSGNVWSNPVFAAGPADAAYASCVVNQAVNQNSDQLHGTALAFSIPSNATITGYGAGCACSGFDAAASGTFSASFSIAGVPIGQSSSSSTNANNPPAGFGSFFVGDSGNLFGLSYTADQINAGALSVDCYLGMANANGFARSFFVESLSVNVYYTLPAPPPLVSVKQSFFVFMF